MARKVFISVLGYSNYSECKYQINDYISEPVRFIQEATLKYHIQHNEWTSNDIAYILLTDGAKQSNWVDNGQIDRTTKQPIKCQGLKSRLDALNTSINISTIENIPNGNNELEVWDIFERTFAHINEGDELYFDLTHGFRYLPMLILTLINYSKFLKNTKVKSITYGNYEAKNNANIAPIIDLLPLSTLQDWTFAAGQYLDSGNVKRLVELSSKNLAPILRDAERRNLETTALKKFIAALKDSIDDFKTCRSLHSKVLPSDST